MDNNSNIDNILRDKFESFAPTPPARIWNEIEKGIAVPTRNSIFTTRRMIVASLLIMAVIISSIFVTKPALFNPSNNTESSYKNDIKSNNPNENYTTETAILEETETDSEKNILGTNTTNTETKSTKINTNKTTKNQQTTQPEVNSELSVKTNEVKDNPKSVVTFESSTYANTYSLNSNSNPVNILEPRQCNILDNELANYTIIKRKGNLVYPIPDIKNYNIEKKIHNSRWEIGYYISPELTVSNIDSVEILNSFNFNVEPQYYINNNWFIRSGLGISYVRDRGFAKINYLLEEYMGSYDDVYDITFDTISGNVVPTYHTKTIEVWDSVRHVSVSNVTNKYLYIQIPALFGYNSRSTSSQLNWYVFGGPAINIQVGNWIENPKPDEKDADIIELENNLPIRSKNYFQLWVGAGINYEINNKLSITAEPSYRYYLDNIYQNSGNKGATSSFTLRFGLIYKMK